MCIFLFSRFSIKMFFINTYFVHIAASGTAGVDNTYIFFITHKLLNANCCPNNYPSASSKLKFDDDNMSSLTSFNTNLPYLYFSVWGPLFSGHPVPRPKLSLLLFATA